MTEYIISQKLDLAEVLALSDAPHNLQNILSYTENGQWGSGGVAPHINLGTTWR